MRIHPANSEGGKAHRDDMVGTERLKPPELVIPTTSYPAAD